MRFEIHEEAKLDTVSEILEAAMSLSAFYAKFKERIDTLAGLKSIAFVLMIGKLSGSE